jgi:aspartate kinase
VVVAGFQGVDEAGNITTLGRGGSDTTAVALAATLHAEECQIYTDVDGVYTTDPRIVPEARRLKTITFEEMLEMASLGSKVLQIRSVEFAGKYKVKLRVLSSFEEGTRRRSPFSAFRTGRVSLIRSSDRSATPASTST